MHILVTRRLTLRPPLEVDLDAITEAIGDYEVSRWLGQVPYPYTLDDARHWYEHVERGPRDRRWTIHDALGLAGVVSISERVREGLDGDTIEVEGPELGYWLGRDRWGRGIMSEAVACVLRDHFDRDGSDVVSGAHEGNAASLAIQTRMGFEHTHEARLPSKAQGTDVTVLRTSLTRVAFEKRFPPASRPDARQAA